MPRQVPLTIPYLSTSEEKALVEVLRSNWITMGELVERFETEFSSLHKVNYGVGVNSCTAALHLALASSGITTGDEVLVPSLTFAATANAVLYCNASPVFVDIESELSPLISLEDARSKLTPKTKAVVVMHYAGYSVNMKAWRQFADENDLLLFEDAAHAPMGTNVGRYSDASTFSFYSNKNMTTAEGGMLLTDNESIATKARLMRSHGMTKSTLTRDRGHAFSYDIVELGYNYRMDELKAALGVVQLKQLPSWNKKRRTITDTYRQLLNNIPEISVPFNSQHPTVGHIMPILLPQKISRTALMAELRQQGVQTSIHYPPVHLFEYHRKRLGKITLSQTESFSSRELTLPLYPTLNEDDIAYVVDTLAIALAKHQ